MAILYLYVLNVLRLEDGPKALIALTMVVIGAYAPNFYVKNAIGKREFALRRGLPDALDLLVICAEAGQSLDGALKRVAREIGRFSPVVADELALTSVELGLMAERRSALDNLVQRAAIPEIRNVVNALIQTEKYGTPLAHTLRVLSAEYRSDRMMKAEEKAARLPAVMTVPMIIFILPPLFVVLLGPAVLRILDQFINR
jgi:tight adherence protein C